MISVDYVNAKFQDMPCEVYFFKRWGTYSHPVTPIDPIEYEEALTRKGFCRAWMCQSSNGNQFSFFEAKKNKVELTNLIKPVKGDNELRFYEYFLRDSGPKIGRELSGSETMGMDSFLVALPDATDYLSLVVQKMSYSYQYLYDDSGALKKVILTGDDGDISTLDY
jgi:hypothetical protein